MSIVPRTSTIRDLQAMLIMTPETPSHIHFNNRINEQIGRIQEAVANVIDKCEHGFSEQAMIEKFANIAGCTKNVLQYEVNAKRYAKA